ncbi:cytochrome c [Pseudooceanicola antarcticus]|uniref:Cytochrome c n=1 Tax=Pseudooceanicola antarcticus TaxID=1247613 RepID=A0A285I0B0_9RHOB|nr:cytochrome c family protein [Pseudooceanicola antarcticus]PJE30281.1 cytochrome c family protein [Pseudooceanicola antarcticus]SNY41412.1 cytochrome c [Pseudooceanicola antarcticus]
MFDTMTGTKIIGGFCGTLLIFLLANWAADELYDTSAGGHGGEEHARGYVIETDEAEGGAVEEEGPSFEELFAQADAGAGERVFNKCKACHKVDGTDGTGPHLNGVVGREVDAVAGFSYSGALEEHFDVWTPENLQAFLENPRSAAPGTKMSFSGLKDMEDRADVIAYLASLDG